MSTGTARLPDGEVDLIYGLDKNWRKVTVKLLQLDAREKALGQVANAARGRAEQAGVLSANRRKFPRPICSVPEPARAAVPHRLGAGRPVDRRSARPVEEQNTLGCRSNFGGTPLQQPPRKRVDKLEAFSQVAHILAGLQ